MGEFKFWVAFLALGAIFTGPFVWVVWVLLTIGSLAYWGYKNNAL